MSDKQLLIDWFYRADLPAGACSFDSVLKDGIEAALKKDALDAASYLEVRRQAIFNYLLESADLDRKEGRHPLLQSDDIASCVFHASLPELDGKLRLKHARSRQRSGLLRGIDALTNREYEALGCVASESIGADSWHLTPRGNDGGIDFFAKIVSPSSSHVLGGGHAPIRVVGQCKKYESRVGVNALREFSATITAVQNRSPEVSGLVPEWFSAGRGPIVGWIISHSGFQSGATQLAANHGVLLSTSLDLAEILAHSKRVPGADPVERWSVVEQRLKTLLPTSPGIE